MAQNLWGLHQTYCESCFTVSSLFFMFLLLYVVNHHKYLTYHTFLIFSSFSTLINLFSSLTFPNLFNCSCLLHELIAGWAAEHSLMRSRLFINRIFEPDTFNSQNEGNKHFQCSMFILYIADGEIIASSSHALGSK